MSALSADLLRVSRQLLLQAFAARAVCAAQLLLRQLLLQTVAPGALRAG